MKKTKNQKVILSEGKEQSSIDVILESSWSLIKKVIRLKSPPPSWIIASIISLIITLVVLIATAGVGGLTSNGLGSIIFGGILIFTNLTLGKLTFNRAFSDLREIANSDEYSESAQKHLFPWFTLARDIKRPLIFAIIVYAINVIFIFQNPGGGPPNRLETLLMGGLMLLWTGFMLYYMYLFVLLPLKLKNCEFKIHKENPASSQILSSWNRMMNFAAYMFAIMLAAGTLFTLSIAPFTVRTLFFIIPRWLLLIVIFIVNQVTISKIITKSKRETLKEVEEEMKSLRNNDPASSIKNLPDLLRLWDYHDRLLKTRNSLLNFMGVIDFFNTLLIPILAFLLANIEEIITFLNL